MSGLRTPIADKLESLKRLSDEIAAGLTSQVSADLSQTGEQPTAALPRRRFDCGSYTCHGHFTCSNFGCGPGFALAD
jgi:hypothetical protein